MTDIFLHGSLAEQYGEHYALDVRDAREAVTAIGVQVTGFFDTIRAGNWHVFRGPVERGNDLDEQGLDLAMGSAREIHIMPVAAGAGGDGVFNVIVGSILIAASFFVPFAGTPLLYAGGAMVLGGVAQMLTSPPGVADYGDRERPEERPSFLFDGPVNTSTQGLPVPLIYGRMRVGSIVVSAGLTAEDVPIEAPS